MEEELKIESLQNPRVKAAVRLRKAKTRRETGRTLVEGYREIMRATESGWRFIELYHCPEHYLQTDATALVSRIQAQGVPVFRCTADVFSKMSYRDTPDGLIALSPRVGKSLAELKLPENPLLLIAEDLEKPGNLGTILRTADAAGADAVIACDPHTDLSNPNLIRSSIGTLFFMPIAEATTEETLHWLRQKGIQSIAAIPGAQQEYTQVDMRRATAIIVGAEDKGLSAVWVRQADHQVSIPMRGRNDSLNVSTAAAVMLYEAVRQRHRPL